MEEKEMSLIDAFVKVGPYLNDLIHDDITVGIYDTEKLIINYPGKTFSLNVKPGDPLVEGDIITKAIRENRPFCSKRIIRIPAHCKSDSIA